MNSLFFVTLLCCSINAYAGQPLNLEQDSSSYMLAPYMQYFEDEAGDMSLDEAIDAHRRGAFQNTHQHTPGFGFSDSAFWFHFRVNNSASSVERWLLQLAYPMLDVIDVYQIDDQGMVDKRTYGDVLPFKQREIEHRTFLFDVNLAPGAGKDFFVRIKTDSSVQAAMYFWDKDAFYNSNQSTHYLFGVYYGVIIAMLFYNLLVFFSIRDRIYIYYVAHILAFSLLMGALNGLSYQYLWPDFPWWQQRANAFFMCMACFNAILFTRSLLSLKNDMPRWEKFFKQFMYFCGVLMLCTLLVPYHIIGQVCTATGLSVSILLNIIGWLSLRKENKLAVFYVMAWTFFLLGASVYALKTYGLLPQMFITEYAMQIGSLLDVLLLSLVLTYRVKLLEEKNVQIQLDARNNLEREVAERTKKLNETLDALSATYAKVEKLNYTDALTDIKNRRFFDEFYAHELNNAVRSNGSIALLVVDVDNFKTINDRYGHQAGDKVLIGVSQCIQECLPRKNDFVARYGGDEFMVVLPFTDKEGALLTAKRIKDKITELQTVNENDVITITISIGLSAIAPGSVKDQEKLLIQADRALYEAKEMGRDRIRSYQNGTVEIKDIDS